jgi:hypothetical protein
VLKIGDLGLGAQGLRSDSVLQELDRDLVRSDFVRTPGFDLKGLGLGFSTRV